MSSVSKPAYAQPLRAQGPIPNAPIGVIGGDVQFGVNIQVALRFRDLLRDPRNTPETLRKMLDEIRAELELREEKE